MGTVVVATNTYTVYGTLTDAKVYYDVAMGAARTAWDTATDDQKSSALVNATRLIDRQVYVAAAATQDLRMNLALFTTACYEFAGMLLVDSSLMTQNTSGSNVKIAKSGSDEVEFFLPTLDATGRFPINIMELIGQYLASVGATDPNGTSGSFSSGTSPPCVPSCDPPLGTAPQPYSGSNDVYADGSAYADDFGIVRGG